MHLVPADRLDRRVIDDERVCVAIDAIRHTVDLPACADRFALLGDPSRLALLVAIRAAGPISVSDLSVAAGLNNTTVSQALRYLRARGLVATERDGRVIRYRLTDASIIGLLDGLTPAS